MGDQNYPFFFGGGGGPQGWIIFSYILFLTRDTDYPSTTAK